jgi:hypothetical protein
MARLAICCAFSSSQEMAADSFESITSHHGVTGPLRWPWVKL